jgi:sucrose-6-phosphate hydrolase SacC (GH32 family)
LLFQHNPHNLLEGYIHWGHAVSPNMLNWLYKGLVLAQPDSATMPTSAMPWWGSVAGNPPGKIFFNRYDLGLFQGTFNHREAIADELSVSSKELFRRCEPFVFRYEPTSRWIMASYDRQQSKLIFFQSVDGHEWHETGSLEHPFGFPALYEMKVDRKPDDKRWVLFGEQGTYLIGQFDGSGFRPEGEVKRFDINNNLGASVCLVEEGSNGRLVMISELKSPAH